VILAALARETERTGAWLATLGEAEWARTTNCAPLTVLELASHAYRGSQRIREMLDAGEATDSEAEKDRLTYWSYDPAAEGATIVKRAQEVAAGFPNGAALVEAWRRDWRAQLARCAPLVADDPLFRCPFGVIRLSDYLATRVVEVAIHTMDMRASLGLGPDPDPGALAVTADVLRGLLGTDARSFGIEDVRFTLTGTGRAPLSDTERDLFGPLADKFPLLA
jgi:uncharacterized protein (TIGR03083 family)